MSFNTVCQPETSPCRVISAGRPFHISAAVASPVCLNLSSVLKLQNVSIQLGPRSEDDKICDELDHQVTVGNKQVSFHVPLHLINDKPVP